MRRTIGMTAAVMAVDLGSKTIAYRWLGHWPMVRLTRNPGLALGAFGGPHPGGPVTVAVGCVGAAVIIAATLLWRRNCFGSVPFACLLGGALANLLDRATTGAVHDWLQIRTVTINAADVFLVVGLVAFVAVAWAPGSWTAVAGPDAGGRQGRATTAAR